MLRSSLQLGTVVHRRWKPAPHGFAYPVFMALLDLGELRSVFDRSPFWSLERFNLVSFHRRDYIGGAAPIEDEVKRRIAEKTGRRFDGRIMMLAHPRYLGFVFNPVSFYFCYRPDASTPEFILAEINNTPWNERHCYVLENRDSHSHRVHFEFGKQFHVSPFMPMDLRYQWSFMLRPEGVRVDMTLVDGRSVCFEARLRLESRPFTAAAMRSVPLQYPLMTLAVVRRIYWQAFRLWTKRIPFYEHPRKRFEEVGYEHDS